jgi:hypothetical protein
MGVPLTNFNIYNVSSQANDWKARLNGLLISSTAANAVGDRGSNIDVYLGGYGYQNGGFAGDIAEIIVYNQVLTQAQRDTVNTYLGIKYGLYTVPPAPTHLSATPLSPGQVSVQWSAALSSSHVAYLVERSTDGVTFTQVASVADGLNYIDTGLTAGTTYTYRVRAQGYAGTSGYSNTAATTTPLSGTDMPLTSQQGMRLWLKADANMNSGGSMTIWADQSGSGNNATQTYAYSAVTPNLVANVSALNGRPMVHFGGGTGGSYYDYFDLPNFLAGASAGEAFVVLRTATSGGGVIWFTGTGGPTSYGSSTISDGFFSTTDQSVGQPSFVALTNFNLYDVSSQANDWEARLNGLSIFSTSTNAVGDRGSNIDVYLGALPAILPKSLFIIAS